MHPAASVIAFTTLSGAGYGVWLWLSLAALTGAPPRATVEAGLWFGAAFVTAGLLSSTWHLRRPERAWRALSQWRSSWLSREAVAALATFVPLTAWLFAVTFGDGAVHGAVVAALAAGSVLTVLCTGKIYASLKAIARWHHPLVVPVYLALALASGGTLWLAVRHVTGAPPAWLAWAVAAISAAAWSLKIAYWRSSDARPPAGNVNSATGLAGTVRVLDPPHTEANYLLEEMGYVVARRRAGALRRLAVILGLGVAPAACVATVAVAPATAALFGALAAVATLLAVLAERWLFFAQAQHSVSHYYDPAVR